MCVWGGTSWSSAFPLFDVPAVVTDIGVLRGGWGVQHPPSEIPKALKNLAKLNPIVKTVKNCWI